MIHTLPYIQDLAGSARRCRIAVSPAKTPKGMRAMLTIVRNKGGDIIELYLNGFRQGKVGLIEHEIRCTACGETNEFCIYDHNKTPISGRNKLVGGKIVYGEEEIVNAFEDFLKYEDTFKDGYLVARKYVDADIKEEFSYTGQTQTISLERWDGFIGVHEKYLEFYDDDHRLLWQSYDSSGLDNSLDIQAKEMYVHYYDESGNIRETYVTFHGHWRGWRTAKYDYFFYEKGGWTKAYVKVVVGANRTGSLYEEEIERKFAYSLRAEEDLLKEYEVLKSLIKRNDLQL